MLTEPSVLACQPWPSVLACQPWSVCQDLAGSAPCLPSSCCVSGAADRFMLSGDGRLSSVCKEVPATAAHLRLLTAAVELLPGPAVCGRAAESRKLSREQRAEQSSRELSAELSRREQRAEQSHQLAVLAEQQLASSKPSGEDQTPLMARSRASICAGFARVGIR